MKYLNTCKNSLRAIAIKREINTIVHGKLFETFLLGKMSVNFSSTYADSSKKFCLQSDGRFREIDE